MKELRVFLQYPWKFPDSPYYKYLINSPPKDIKYLNTDNKENVILNQKIFFILGFLKKLIKFTLSSLNAEKPNSHKTKSKEKYDLIHCAHCLSEEKYKPWVADIEMYGSLFIAKKRSDKLDKKIKEIILRNNCKKILPWSNGIKRLILNHIPEIENKMEVVYPAIPFKKEKINKELNKNSILFSSRYFYTKGGLIALEVMNEINNKFGWEGVVVSNVPEKLKRVYPNLRFYNLLPQKELFKIMQNSQIYLYPSTSDTFGFSLLEAMSFGIPVITLKTIWTPSIDEIITHNKTGLIENLNRVPSQREIGKFEKEIINKLIKKCELLIKNNNLRERMSKNTLKEIKEGKFSIKNRNKKLRKIYEEALK